MIDSPFFKQSVESIDADYGVNVDARKHRCVEIANLGEASSYLLRYPNARALAAGVS